MTGEMCIKNIFKWNVFIVKSVMTTPYSAPSTLSIPPCCAKRKTIMCDPWGNRNVLHAALRLPKALKSCIRM